MFRQLSRQTVRALPRSRTVYSRPIHNTLIPHTGANNTEQQKNQRKAKWTTPYSRMTQADTEKRLLGEDNTNQKKRKFPWKTAYSSMTVNEVQNRIGIRIQDLYSAMIPVEEMLVQVGYSLDEEGSKAILMTKEDVYKQIVRYLRTEGYPESSPDFKESNVSDLVLLTILPILDDFMCSTGRQKLRLCREKQIVSGDLETGGNEEYIVIDQISLAEERYILIVEAKRSSLGAAMGQCLVSLKDMGDKNGGGAVYGFITTGESWRMLSYDGKSFQVTDKIDVLFGTMGKSKEKWMRDYSVVVDCIYVALSKGGIVEK